MSTHVCKNWTFVSIVPLKKEQKLKKLRPTKTTGALLILTDNALRNVCSFLAFFKYRRTVLTQCNVRLFFKCESTEVGLYVQCSGSCTVKLIGIYRVPEFEGKGRYDPAGTRLCVALRGVAER